MTTKKIHDTKGDDFIRGTRFDDWIVNSKGADTIYGRKGNDLVESYSGDDFVFYGGKGDDVVEISNVPKQWDWIVLGDESRMTIEFFKTVGDEDRLMQTVQLFNVEDYHIHHDQPFFSW